MANNSSGSYHVSRERQMAAYDKLPPTARKAMQDAAFDWATPPFLTRWKKGVKGYKTGADIAATIASADARATERDRWKVWRIGERPVSEPKRKR